MAITSEITTNIPSDIKPDGYTPPAITINFTGETQSANFTTTIAASGVTDAANEVTGITSLVAAIKTWIDGTFNPDILKLDAAQTINMVIKVNAISRDNAENTTTKKLYLTGTDTFTVSGTVEYQ